MSGAGQIEGRDKGTEFAREMSRHLKHTLLIALALLTAACGKSIHTESIKPKVLLEPVQCVAVMPFENDA